MSGEQNPLYQDPMSRRGILQAAPLLAIESPPQCGFNTAAPLETPHFTPLDTSSMSGEYRDANSLRTHAVAIVRSHRSGCYVQTVDFSACQAIAEAANVEQPCSRGPVGSVLSMLWSRAAREAFYSAIARPVQL